MFRKILTLLVSVLLLLHCPYVIAQSIDEADSLRIQATSALDARDYDHALADAQKSVDLYRAAGYITSMTYAESLRILSSIKSETGNTKDAIEVNNEALSILGSSADGRKSLTYAWAVLDQASYYSDLSLYAKALSLGLEAMSMIETIEGIQGEYLSVALAKLAMFYENVGDHEKSMDIGLKALTQIGEAYGQNCERYAQMLDLLSYIYYERGDLERAIRYCRNSCDIYGRISFSPFYVNALNDLAAYYCDNGDIQEAISLGVQAKGKAGEIYGENSSFYINTVNNLARYYAASGDCTSAISYCRLAQTVCENIGMTANISYARSLGHLSNFYAQTGDYANAVKYAEKAEPLLKAIFGDGTPGYANSLHDLSRYYYYSGNLEKASDYMCQTEREFEDIVLRAFSYMSSHDRALYWNWYKNWFYNEMPQFCIGMKSRELNGLTYDALLFSKGILLNTDVEEKRILSEDGGEESVAMLRKLQSLRASLDLIQSSDDGSMAQRDSLLSEISSLTDSLSKRSSNFGSYIRNQSIKWQDVRDRLSPGELSVEFMKVDMESEGCFYAALTLKHSYKYPHLTMLFDEGEFRNVGQKDYYRSSRLCDLIWGNLESELKGVKKVYFSPDGILHTIGLEHLPLSDKRNISDRYRLYRLTSTRELVRNCSGDTRGDIVLYGGLDYDRKAETDQSACVDSTIDLSSAIASNLYRGISNQGYFGAAPNAMEEVSAIYDLMTSSGENCRLYSGIEGTEESFKHLSGSDLSLVHLATHGKYVPLEDAGRSRYANNLAYQEAMARDYSEEDLAMTRSFIVLSGGNMILSVSPEEWNHGEDGILTSLEVSKLDFSKLKLVVLSACETALGDASEDGVVGLQRGFKKAGANSIVMSLWPVSGPPTEYLMLQFYNYMSKGKSVYGSFRKAQTDLKKAFGTSGNKPYWAAFILLDAV